MPLTIASYKNLHTPTTFVASSFLALLIHGSLEAEVPTSPASPLSHTLGKVEFTLDNKNKHCLLRVKKESSGEGKTIPLVLEVPCYWVVSGETKALLHYSYETADAENTLLVAGTQLDWSADKKAYQKLPDNAFCSQFLQGIVVSRNEVYAVDEKMVAAHCETGLAIDEKIFYTLAHSPKRYQDKSIEDIEATAKPVETQNAVKSGPTESKPKDTEEKSFLDNVTDSLKDFFSRKTEDAK